MKTCLREDLTDKNSFIFGELTHLTELAAECDRAAERYREFNRLLVYNIQEGRIKDTDTFNCAMAWFRYYERYTPEQCIAKALEE